jgi:hypothetical protein
MTTMGYESSETNSESANSIRPSADPIILSNNNTNNSNNYSTLIDSYFKPTGLSSLPPKRKNMLIRKIYKKTIFNYDLDYPDSINLFFLNCDSLEDNVTKKLIQLQRSELEKFDAGIVFNTTTANPALNILGDIKLYSPIITTGSQENYYYNVEFSSNGLRNSVLLIFIDIEKLNSFIKWFEHMLERSILFTITYVITNVTPFHYIDSCKLSRNIYADHTNIDDTPVETFFNKLLTSGKSVTYITTDGSYYSDTYYYKTEDELIKFISVGHIGFPNLNLPVMFNTKSESLYKGIYYMNNESKDHGICTIQVANDKSYIRYSNYHLSFVKKIMMGELMRLFVYTDKYQFRSINLCRNERNREKLCNVHNKICHYYTNLFNSNSVYYISIDEIRYIDNFYIKINLLKLMKQLFDRFSAWINHMNTLLPYLKCTINHNGTIKIKNKTDEITEINDISDNDIDNDDIITY